MGRFILGYGIFSFLWFLITTPLLHWLTQDPRVLLQMATLRGVVVAIVGMVLLYRVDQRQRRVGVQPQSGELDNRMVDKVIKTKQLQERLQFYFDWMPIGLMINDCEGYFVEWNPTAEKIFGYTREEVILQQTCDLIAPLPQREHVAQIRQQAITTNSSISINSNVTKDGRTIICEWHNIALRDANSQFIGILSMVQDVTEREQAKEQLRESEARFRSLIDSLPFCCWVYDTEGRYTFQNLFDIQQWGDVIGCSQDDLIGAAGGPLDIWRDLRQRAMNGEIIRCEADYTFGERTQSFLTIAAPVRAGDRIYGVVGASIDITEQKRTEAQLRYYAFHDRLTQLPQRSILLEQLAELMQANKAGDSNKFALLHLDLPRFKIIKYSLGHQLAEALLIAMAERLKTLLPPSALLTRASGIDEFSILLKDLTNFDEASRFAEFLLHHIALPFHLQDHEIFVNANIGIALSSHAQAEDQEVQAETLFRAADIAMHQAQQVGEGNYAVFDPAVQVQAVQRLQMDSELRRAIAQEDFILHYQPIINLATRQLTGFEVLVRWDSLQRGVVSPGEFIPLAEETGMIIPLGAWVLKRACEQLQQWQKQFTNSTRLTLSVNLSTVQLLQPDLLEQIDAILHTTQISPDQLKLEITETSIVQNAQQVTPILQALKDRHIHLSLDDFGTGYSSLTYLHTFPIDTLKIDRVFVTGIGNNSESLEIARTIILLAHRLDMDVVAEGIETVAQMEQLRALSCDFGQGYLFAHPLPANRVEHMLTGDRWIL